MQEKKKKFWRLWQSSFVSAISISLYKSFSETFTEILDFTWSIFVKFYSSFNWSFLFQLKVISFFLSPCTEIKNTINFSISNGIPEKPQNKPNPSLEVAFTWIFKWTSKYKFKYYSLIFHFITCDWYKGKDIPLQCSENKINTQKNIS